MNNLKKQIKIDEYNKIVLCNDPDIYYIDNFLSDEECNHFITIKKDEFKRALVSSNGTTGIECNMRTNTNAWVQHDYDNITLNIGNRVSELVNMPLNNAESFQVIHYSESQQYFNHYDSWTHDYSEQTLNCIKNGGPRLLTALLYLNDVEEGGGTHFSKLDIIVRAIKGRLLVFENVYKGGHFKHVLSEHAGMPVIKGEKYAINLWYRECSYTELYSNYNPFYYNNVYLENNNNSLLSCLIQDINYIKYYDNFITADEYQLIMNNVSFNELNKRQDCWIDIEKLPSITKKIESLIGINSCFFENYNAILYRKSDHHYTFLDGYDLTSEIGKKYCEKIGQRMYTVVLFLTNKCIYMFNNLNIFYESKQNGLLIYKNTIDNTNKHNDRMLHTIINNEDNIIINLYIREKDLEDNVISNIISIIPEIDENNNENYTETYNEFLQMFKNNKINGTFYKHKSFEYVGKVEMSIINKYLSQIILKKEQNQNSILFRNELLDNNYDFSEFSPLVINNVLDKNVLNIFKDYYNETISKSLFDLGDIQSNRYKEGNEIMSRILQFELLPLIETILKKKVKPTYTYISAYIKDSDLPPHTDRPDCEYTVSFLVNKPDNSNWPIYVHKVKQYKKYVGKYEFTPQKNECIEVDCDSGGLMMFCGTDHIHYREKLDFDFYNVLLLHYCSL